MHVERRRSGPPRAYIHPTKGKYEQSNTYSPSSYIFFIIFGGFLCFLGFYVPSVTLQCVAFLGVALLLGVCYLRNKRGKIQYT